MSKNLKSLVFASILCVVCSVLLTAAATGLKSFQQRNIAVDRQKNILRAFGLVEDEGDMSAGRIEEMYQTYVKHLWVDTSGRVIDETKRSEENLSIYVHMDDSIIKAYAIPIDTRGLWGPIHGYLAIDNDGMTVRGFTVYQHQETPGLGGEIESRWFRNNFEGKKILNASGDFVSIGIAKGSVEDTVPLSERMNYVDGISGATLTGKFLTVGLRKVLQEYEPVAIRFRQHNIRLLNSP
jgi:Na+-transporting NADH:ubiquinone oxidoreductase subunit C